MILLSGGIKGGAGKTTLAVNLAIMRALEGRDVLLVDADDQATAADFTALRAERREGGPGYTCVELAGRAVRDQVLRLAPKYDDVVIDTGGRDTTSQRAALSVAETFVIPFVPRSFDIWTLERLAELVDQMRLVNPTLRALMCINRGDHQGSYNDEAADYLREAGAGLIEMAPVRIGHRKVFGHAASDGLAVVEYKPADTKAIGELRQLYEAAYAPAAYAPSPVSIA